MINRNLIVAFFAVVAVVTVAYWPTAAMLDSLKWDTLDCFFPWRSFVADCVAHRIFPLWNPYQHLGYPIYADLRSVFYPEPWLVGLLGGYTLSWLHGLYVFYLAVAGLGMYHLSGRFVADAYVRTIIACAYPLCGFFVGHGQDMAVYVSGAWMPWSLSYFLRLQSDLKWGDAWKLILFLFLHLTGGYHALNIIYVYLLLFLGVIPLVSNIREKRFNSVKKLVLLNVTVGILTTVTILPLMLSYLEAAPHLGRLSGLSLKEVYVGFLTPWSLSSFLTPFAVTYPHNLAETDMTMQNAYVGLIVLVFFFMGLFVKKRAELTTLLVFGTMCLLASLGPYTPVRELLYNYFPGMDLFRMSSYFSYFAQLAIFPVAALGMEKLLERSRDDVLFKRSLGFTFLLVLVCGIVAYTEWPTASVEALAHMLDLDPVKEGFSFSQRVVVHTVIQIIFLIALFTLFRTTDKGQQLKGIGLGILVFAEMTVAVRLNHSATIGGGFNPHELQAKLDRTPKGFPLPDTKTELKWNTDSHLKLNPLYHNTNILTKSFSANGFNSFTLQRFDDLADNNTEVFQEALKQPLVSSANKLTEIRMKDFNPNLFVIETNSSEPDSVTLNQVYFPGWTATVNGQQTDLSLRYDALPTIPIPAGKNQVVFKFENDRIKIVGLISGIACLLVLALSLFYSTNDRVDRSQKAVLMSALSMLFVLGTIGLLYARTSSNRELKAKNYSLLCEQIHAVLSDSSAPIIFQVDDALLMDSLLSVFEINNPVFYAWNAGGEALRSIDKLNVRENPELIHAGWNQPKDIRISALLAHDWPLEEEFDCHNGFIAKRVSGKSVAPFFIATNDFESTDTKWHYNGPTADSALTRYSGLHGWKIWNEEHGSPGILVTIDSLMATEDVWLEFKAQCLVSTEHAGLANMYTILERNGEKVWEAAEGLNAMARGSRDWFPAVLIATPSVELLPNDVLRVFVWGSDGDPIYLDDMSFAIYPEERFRTASSE